MINMLDEQNGEFMVLVNDEGQRSLWPHGLSVPAGWRSANFEGKRDQCLEHVKATWTDMKPQSLSRA